MSVADASEPSGVDARRRGHINANAKRRQNTLLVTGCVAIVLVAVGVTWVAKPQWRSLPQLGEAEVRLDLPSENVTAGELWRTSAERDIQALQDGWDGLQESLSQMQRSLDGVQGDINDTRAAVAEASFERELLQLIPTEPRPAISSLPEKSGNVVPPFEPPPPAIRMVKVGARGAVAGLAAAAIPTPPITAPAADVARLTPRAPTAAAPAHGQDYLPSGAFMPAVILGGIDAPTGAVSRDNPHPVLLRVSAPARLPNLALRDLRECFVLAAGYGDISSERALLRTERLSCRRDDGTFLDTQLRGFIVGEDGRAGVRGRLVTKQGQILQRSLLAGIGSGLSQVFRSRQSELVRQASSDDATGTEAGVPRSQLGDYAQIGLSAGLQSSLDRLADYYIALAERVYPVIEVGAGRKVDIVVQEGVNLGP